jgi:hypothetical protein
MFAEDLRAGCDELFAAYGNPSVDTLSLPISIPIDHHGVVLLQPEGPLDAPRVAATLYVSRPTNDYYGIRLERQDGGRLVIPGMVHKGDLSGLGFTIGRRGMAIEGCDPGGRPVPVAYDEPTARALANALFVTLRMKIIKAPNPPFL